MTLPGGMELQSAQTHLKSTCALLTNVPLALADMFAVKLNVLVPLVAAMPVLLVQVMTLEDALQLQSAAFAPLKAREPSATLMPLGRTSTIVMVALEAVFPVLETVSA